MGSPRITTLAFIIFLTLINSELIPNSKWTGLGPANSFGIAPLTLTSRYALRAGYANANKTQSYTQVLAQTANSGKSEAERLFHQGKQQLNNKQFQAAIQSLEQALALYQQLNDTEGQDNVFSALRSAYKQMGDNKRALEYGEQQVNLARQRGDQSSEGLLLRGLGDDYYCQQDWKNAIATYERGLAIAKENGDKLEQGLVQGELGKVLLKTGNVTQAELILREGIQATELARAQLGSDDERNRLVFELQDKADRIMQQVLVAQNQTNVALEISENGRAQAFAELLAKRQSPELDDRRAGRSIQENLSPENKQPLIKSPTFQEIQQIAKAEKATLVEYTLAYDEFTWQCQLKPFSAEIYIWVIKPTGEVLFRRVTLKPMNQQLETSLEFLVDKNLKSIVIGIRGLTSVSRIPNDNQQIPKPQLQKLHQVLIQPIANILPNDPSERVIFIPQHCLFYVPFPALQDRSGKYLIEDHTILTSPSIQVLDLTHQQRQKLDGGQGALVVGNPSPMPENLLPLPGSEREAQAVAQLLKTEPIIGSKASISTVLPQMLNARIIHLATHGLLDDNFGGDSAIALAPPFNPGSPIRLVIPGGEMFLFTRSGLLRAREIDNLKLKAELVVLSACNTGLGAITGDGVIGLSRSFISAGVPSIIVSLWSIPDAPTASLMTEFYRNFQQKPDKASALRQAMLTTMKQFPSPRDWAAFTIIGEAE